MDLQKYFIRGFFDGDGTVCIDSRKCFRLSFSGPLDYEWTFLKKFCNQHQIENTTVNRVVNSRKCGGSNFVIQRRLEQVKFLEIIYDGYENDRIGLSRKYQKLQDMKFNLNNGIKSIGKLEEKTLCKCGKEKNISSDLCRSCNASKGKKQIPTKDELLNVIQLETRLTVLCKNFNVSHNTFKKWLSFHNIVLV